MASLIPEYKYNIFIPGVNRPLTPDDYENSNLNKTTYSNQINKVGNAVKEIISGLKIVAAITAYPRIFKSKIPEKPSSSVERISVAVILFQNLTNDTISSPDKIQKKQNPVKIPFQNCSRAAPSYLPIFSLQNKQSHLYTWSHIVLLLHFCRI